MEEYMKKWILLFCTLFFLAGWLSAQQTNAGIYGSTVLQDGSAIPGVMVTLTADVLGTQTTVTSDEGNFRFVRLLPGSYELKFELEGFKTLFRKGIRLYAGKNVTLTIPMELSSIKEEVVVTAKSNVVDTRRTSVGMNITKEALQTLPSSRNPWSVISMAPGVMNDAADVGGSESAQQSHPNAGGSDYTDTVWNVDGIDNSSMATVGTSTGYLDVNNYEELQVSTGASDITAQTGGVQINFVSKRGGNKMAGDFHMYMEDKAWEMKHDAPEAPPVSPYVTPGINRLYQLGASLGGPIKKDKMWWFGTWSMQDIHVRSMSGDEAAYLLTNGYTKLNAQFGNTSAELSLSYDRKLNNAYLPKSSLSISQVTPDAWREQTMPNYYYYGTLQQIFGNLMLNAKVGIIHQVFNFEPKNLQIDPLTGHQIGNDAVRYSKSYIKASGSANDWFGALDQADFQLEGNLFLEKLLGGDHELRFGVEYNSINALSETLHPNQRTLYVKNYGDFTSSLGIWLQPDNKIDSFFERMSGYISDTATFKRLTLNLGVRYDLQAPRINKTVLPGFTWVDKMDATHNGLQFFQEYLGPLTIQEFSPPSWKAFSPRLSLSYDITGDGKNVLKFSAAQYGSRGGISNMIWPLLPNGGSGREIDIYWYYDNGDGIPTFNELTYYGYDYYAYANYCYDIDPKTGRVNASFDKNYKSPLLDELTLSFEKQLAEDLAVSVTGFYKKQHSGIRSIGIMEDGSLETKDNWYLKYTQMVNGSAVDVWDRLAVPVGTYYTNYGSGTYSRYMAVQLALTKKFSNKWMADASFMYQDWKQFTDANEEFNMTNYNYFNEGPYYAHSMRGAGDIYVNSRWQFKVSGLYQLPWGINLSAIFSAQEGYIVGNYVQSDKKLKGGSKQILYESNKKFGDDRLPAFWTLNLGLEKRIMLGSDGRTAATIFVDAYNLTNNDTILGQGAQFGTTSFGLTTNTLNPGLFQFGFRLNF
jgi:hypothetical protein